MKRFLTLLFALITVFTINAQHRAFVWNHDRSITISSSQPDSITFEKLGNIITLSTGDPSDATDDSMTAYYVSKSTFSFNGSDLEMGVCYSTVDNEPTVNNSREVFSKEVRAQTWKQTINKLDKDRTYYYRAYAQIGDQVFYGPVKQFTTGDGEQKFTTPAYVDLGLSVKWATCNVGATKPEEVGKPFAWGETTSKGWSNFNQSTYKYWDSETQTWTKYCSKDGKVTLLPDDDAATVNLGKPWRMPTYEEIQELLWKSTWTGEKLNGVTGQRIVGPNGNSIFLPIVPSYENGGDRGNGRSYYWSSSRYEGSDNNIYILYFGNGRRSWEFFDRYDGMYIRPVQP